MPQWIRELEEAANDEDLLAMRRQAHKLLGLCQQIGAIRMAEACRRLESSEYEVADDELKQDLSALQREFEVAHRELDNRHLNA